MGAGPLKASGGTRRQPGHDLARAGVWNLRRTLRKAPEALRQPAGRERTRIGLWSLIGVLHVASSLLVVLGLLMAEGLCGAKAAKNTLEERDDPAGRFAANGDDLGVIEQLLSDACGVVGNQRDA